MRYIQMIGIIVLFLGVAISDLVFEGCSSEIKRYLLRYKNFELSWVQSSLLNIFL